MGDVYLNMYIYIQHNLYLFLLCVCAGCVCDVEVKLYEHLLSLLNLQFHANAEAAKSVLKCLPESFLHQNLMKNPNHNSTNKHHRI